MRLVLIVLAFIFTGALTEKKCPFPGIPANAVARNGQNENITWGNHSHFSEQQIVKYFCVGLDEANERFAGEFSCKDNGKWNDSLPLCGKQL